MAYQSERALVLSGGGGRGAYHIGVLRFLEEVGWDPTIIVGTSIGAVNGAAIASGHTSESLWELWRNLRTHQVQQFAWKDFLGLKWDHLLDTNPLRRTLLDGGWINLRRLNASPPAKQLRITVVEVDTGRLRVFGNSPDSSARGRCQHVGITVDHILASCSIPVVYPATRIDTTAFWDGGTVANTPLGPAIDAGAQEIVVVLMTPWEVQEDRPVYTPVNVQGRGLGRLLTSAQAAFEWAIIASFQADLRLFNRTNQLLQLQSQEASHPLPYRQVEPPIIISPKVPIPTADIIRYEPKNHKKLYQMGYENAREAWEKFGKSAD